MIIGTTRKSIPVEWILLFFPDFSNNLYDEKRNKCKLCNSIIFIANGYASVLPSEVQIMIHWRLCLSRVWEKKKILTRFVLSNNSIGFFSSFEYWQKLPSEYHRCGIDWWNPFENWQKEEIIWSSWISNDSLTINNMKQWRRSITSSMWFNH